MHFRVHRTECCEARWCIKVKHQVRKRCHLGDTDHSCHRGTFTNKFQFCALPFGFLDFTLEDAPENGYKEYACFWTADEDEEDNSLGVFRYIYQKDNSIQRGLGDKETLALSVRCVKD